MKTNHLIQVFSFVLCSASLASCSASNAEIISEARSIEVSLMRHLPSGMMSWIQAKAADVATARLSEDDVRQSAREHVTGEDPDGRGSDVLTFFVMMEAVRTLDKQSVDNRKQTEALGRAKTKIDVLAETVTGDLSKNSDKDDSDPCACASYEAVLNDLAGTLELSKTWITVAVREPSDVGDLKALGSDLDHMKNTVGELSEMQQLRLQASTDRMSRLMQTISNLMKKALETEASIIQNLK